MRARRAAPATSARWSSRALFEGKSLVERQRLVYGALAEMMGPEIHALAMQTLTPDQWQEQLSARSDELLEPSASASP